MLHAVSRVATPTLLALAVTAMILQAGSMAHLHEGADVGFYNQEHDLTLLAGLVTHALVADGAPAMTIGPVSTSVPSPARDRPALAVTHSSDCRAPPVS